VDIASFFAILRGGFHPARPLPRPAFGALFPIRRPFLLSWFTADFSPRQSTIVGVRALFKASNRSEGPSRNEGARGTSTSVLPLDGLTFTTFTWRAHLPARQPDVSFTCRGHWPRVSSRRLAAAVRSRSPLWAGFSSSRSPSGFSACLRSLWRSVGSWAALGYLLRAITGNHRAARTSRFKTSPYWPCITSRVITC